MTFGSKRNDPTSLSVKPILLGPFNCLQCRDEGDSTPLDEAPDPTRNVLRVEKGLLEVAYQTLLKGTCRLSDVTDGPVVRVNKLVDDSHVSSRSPWR
jgi:hypothetical protein